MKLSKETELIQNSLALYCRSGVEPPIQVSRPESLPHYRRLVFNVVLNTMKQAFPIAYKNIGPNAWNEMVHDFFLNHDSQAPQIWKLPFEFYQFVLDSNYAVTLRKPFLNDLLKFEWFEIEVHTMPDIEKGDFKKEGNLFTDKLVINPEFKLFKLNYPVHLHPPDKTTNLKGEYYVIAFRHPDDLSVRFLNLSILHVYFIENLAGNELNVNQIINRAINIFNVNNKELTINISTFLNDLFDQKLILGYQI